MKVLVWQSGLCVLSQWNIERREYDHPEFLLYSWWMIHWYWYIDLRPFSSIEFPMILATVGRTARTNFYWKVQTMKLSTKLVSFLAMFSCKMQYFFYRWASAHRAYFFFFTFSMHFSEFKTFIYKTALWINHKGQREWIRDWVLCSGKHELVYSVKHHIALQLESGVVRKIPRNRKINPFLVCVRWGLAGTTTVHGLSQVENLCTNVTF